MNKQMKIMVLMLLSSFILQGGVEATLFHETFETNAPMAGMLGVLDGQHGWSDPSSNAIVQTDESWDFDQAVSINNAEISRALVLPQAKTQVVFAWKPVVVDVATVDIPSDATTVCWINTNGFLCAYSNQTAVEISGTSVDTSQWSRVLIQSDYTTKEWSLWLDGVQAIDGFPFYATYVSHLVGITFSNPTTSSAYVDDIQVSTNFWAPQPGDTDGDGLADDWEVLYFRTPNAISSGMGNYDLDGFTDGEEEVAYTDPTDPRSFFAMSGGTLTGGGTGYVIYWPSTSGRLYDVDFSTNLVDGSWDNLADNLLPTPPENTYTVLVNSAEACFIRVRGRKE